MAAADLPGQDALARLAADIGVEKRSSGAPERVGFGDARERDYDRLESGDVLVSEATRTARRPGDYVHGAIRKEQRRSQIIGGAFGAQIAQHCEVRSLALVGESAPHRSE